MDTDLQNLFSAANLRLTDSRKHIFTTLKNADGPLLLTQIIARSPNADKVSVYRTIKLFTELGIVSVTTRGWKQTYELASPFQPHHHHLVCTQCGGSIDIQSPAIEVLVQSLADHHGFIPSTHHFEIQGTCRNCSLHS